MPKTPPWDTYGLYLSIIVAALLCSGFIIGAFWLGNYCSLRHDQEFVKETYQKAVTASKQFEEQARTSGKNYADPSTFADRIEAYEYPRTADEKTSESEEQYVGWWQSFGCEIKITDFCIALFTLALTVVTYFLWHATYRLWKAGERQIAAIMIAAKAAESQAETSRREFLLTNRPLLRIQAMTLLGRDETTFGPHLSQDFPIRGSIYVINDGLTVATIIDSSLEVFIYDGRLPARPPYEEGERQPFVHGKWAAGQYNRLPIRGPQCQRKMVDLILADEPNTGLNLYVVGFIRYTDELDNPRTTRFCSRYRPNQREFAPVQSPDYEYEE